MCDDSDICCLPQIVVCDNSDIVVYHRLLCVTTEISSVYPQVVLCDNSDNVVCHCIVVCDDSDTVVYHRLLCVTTVTLLPTTDCCV